MSDKVILRLSNGMGNQMFMYAAAYAISKLLNRELFIDEETAFSGNKISKYGLNALNFTSKIAPKNLKFLNLNGYLKRKLTIKIDKFRKNKSFYIEYKDKNKITFYDDSFLKKNFAKNLFLEGHFESEKYFHKFQDEIRNEFSFKHKDTFLNNPYYKLIKESNSVAICIRQHRFSERFRTLNSDDLSKSKTFTNEQINYVKKSVDIIKTKITNPKFFLWSNDYNNLINHFPENKFTMIMNDKHISQDKKIGLDLFLLSQAKNHIVIPSAFNWWGCWLSTNDEKIVYRPSNNYFSNFKIHNKNFWPEEWKVL